MGFFSPSLRLPASNNSFPRFPTRSSLSSLLRQQLHPFPWLSPFGQTLAGPQGRILTPPLSQPFWFQSISGECEDPKQSFSLKGTFPLTPSPLGFAFSRATLQQRFMGGRFTSAFPFPASDACAPGSDQKLLSQEILRNCCSSRSPSFSHRRNRFPPALGNQQSS